MTNILNDLFDVNFGGFEFVAKIQEYLEISQEISNFPNQAGSTLSDNVFSKPLELGLSAIISDKMIKLPFADLEKKAIGTIGSIQAFSPTFSSKAQNFVSKIFSDINKTINVVESIENAGLALYHIISGNDSGNKAKFLEFLLKAYNSKELITVSFEDAVFENMVIESADVAKSNEDGALRVDINLKQYVEIKNELFNFSNPVGFLSHEAKKMIDKVHSAGFLKLF